MLVCLCVRFLNQRHSSLPVLKRGAVNQHSPCSLRWRPTEAIYSVLFQLVTCTFSLVSSSACCSSSRTIRLNMHATRHSRHQTRNLDMIFAPKKVMMLQAKNFWKGWCALHAKIPMIWLWCLPPSIQPCLIYFSLTLIFYSTFKVQGPNLDHWNFISYLLLDNKLLIGLILRYSGNNRAMTQILETLRSQSPKAQTKHHPLHQCLINQL